MKEDDLEFEDEIYKEPNSIKKISSDNNNKNKKKKPFFIFLIFIIIIVGCVFAYDKYYGNGIVKTIIMNYINNVKEEIPNEAEKEENIKTAKKEDYMTFSSDSKSSFKVYGEGFIHCTKDGIKYYSEMGKEKWNDTFTMTSPYISTEGEFIAVADIMGRTAKMYNSKGKVYEISLDAPIVKIALNKNGFMGVIMNSSGNYIIKIINSLGNVVTERVEATANIFPTGLDISEDDKSFSISYVDTTDISAISKIVFFYIGETEGDYIDGMFSGITKQNEYIVYLYYMENNTLVAVSDKSVIAMDSIGKEIWTYSLPNKLDWVSFSARTYIALGCGEEMESADGYKNGTVIFLNLQGKEIGTFESDNEITYLEAYSDGTVVGNSKKFTMVKKSGSVIWEHSATQDINDIIPIKGNNVLYITNNYAQYVNIKNYVPVVNEKNSNEKTEDKETETNNNTENNTEDTTNTSETVQTEENNTEENVQ